MDNTVKITIDGREYAVPKGTLLVDAAKSVGIEIPVFCYHPKLKPVGACRMCLVEVEKAPKLQTACTAPVADGMIVHTKSAKAVAGQNATLEFLLANHPLDCPVCDKGGECPLQDNAFGFGKGMSRFAEVKRHYVKPIPLSDQIYLDRERCIMCYRCVRFTREIAGDETLTVLERGSWSQIGVMEGRTFDSPFSGNTIEICPVGALTSAQYRFRARPWDIVNVPTLCVQCPVGCNVNLTVRTNQIARLISRENGPVDDGWLCDRGRFTYEFANSPDRLTQPLVRRNGELQPTSWEDAITVVRDRVQETLVKRGPNAIAALASPRSTNEDAYLLQKLMRVVVGTNNVDYTFRPHPAANPLGFDAASGSIAGLERANTIVLADVNPIREQPVLDLRIKKAQGRGSKLVIIGPETDLVKFAALWLPTAPEHVSDVLQAMLAVIARDNLVKTEFVEGRVNGAADMVAAVKGIDVTAVATSAGVPVAGIEAAASLYASAGNASLLYRRSTPYVRLVTAAANLALLTGQIGRPGAGVYPLVVDPNEQGMIDVGATPTRLPGQRALGDPSARAELAELWGRGIPDAPGISGAETFAAAREGRLAGLILIEHDPVGDPSLGASAGEALAALDFLVVQDLFVTETAKLATVVLPATSFAEKDGTLTNLERRVQQLRPGIRSAPTVWSEWRFLRELGLALGGDFDYGASTDVLAEMASTMPIYAGITHARIGLSGVQWPRGAGGGTESLYADPTTRFAGAPVPPTTPAGSNVG